MTLHHPKHPEHERCECGERAPCHKTFCVYPMDERMGRVVDYDPETGAKTVKFDDGSMAELGGADLNKAQRAKVEADKIEPEHVGPGFGLISLLGGVMVCLFVCAFVVPLISRHHVAFHKRPQGAVVTNSMPAPVVPPAEATETAPVTDKADINEPTCAATEGVGVECEVAAEAPEPKVDAPGSLQMPTITVLPRGTELVIDAAGNAVVKPHEEISAPNLITRHHHHDVPHDRPHVRHHWPRHVCATEQDSIADAFCAAARASGQIE